SRSARAFSRSILHFAFAIFRPPKHKLGARPMAVPRVDIARLPASLRGVETCLVTGGPFRANPAAHSWVCPAIPHAITQTASHPLHGRSPRFQNAAGFRESHSLALLALYRFWGKRPGRAHTRYRLAFVL